MNRKKVLFICTHNSARSQIAEGLLNALYPERYIAYSAGTDPGNVNPYAIDVLKEKGIDISLAKSKSTKIFSGKEMDYVVTVCDNAKETCPVFPGGRTVIHKSFDDPSEVKGNKEEILNAFRKARDEIKDWLIDYFGDQSR